MTTEIEKTKRSLAATFFRGLLRMLTSLLLAAASALVLAIVIPTFAPNFFGSCFEGGCGYAATFFFAPITTLILAPIWWFALRRAEPLAHLTFWFVLLLIFGYFILVPRLWLTGLAGLLVVMVWLWYGNHRKGGHIRNLLILPKRKDHE